MSCCDQRSNAATEIDVILKSREPLGRELHHITRDGRRLFVESRQVPAPRRSNDPVGILEINRDVTERKRAESEAQRASELSRLALESAQMGTWSLDVPSRQLSWDERCANIFLLWRFGRKSIDHAEVIAESIRNDRPPFEEIRMRLLMPRTGRGRPDWIRVMTSAWSI